jgi:hypothetical protein
MREWMDGREHAAQVSAAAFLLSVRVPWCEIFTDAGGGKTGGRETINTGLRSD